MPETQPHVEQISKAANIQTPGAALANELTGPVTELQGVGSERAKLLAKLGIFTINDLLLHAPRRYEDRRQFRPISGLQLGEPVMTRGQVVTLGVKYWRQRARSVFELVLDDGTARLHCRWWNLPYMQKYFKKGDEVVVFGKPLSLKPRTIDHPETEVIEEGEERSIHLNRVVPIYPATEGLSQNLLRALTWRALERFAPLLEEPYPQLNLSPTFQSRCAATRTIHFPNELAEVEAARRRLALDEFIVLQLGIRRRRLVFQAKAKALPCSGTNQLVRPFLKQLGFPLTNAQTRVLREFRQELSGAHPMRRLLQGDVGSGKTVVAACCALMVLESGFNVALMAPTEILAEQHFATLSRWLKPLSVNLALRTGSHKTPEADTAGKGPTIFVGTHALISEGFNPGKLGLVIIDEQHKFGVSQREQLLRKGVYPHLLVMTATPIPRTLGLTLYGDLDVSVLDELPPGRGSIRTFIRSEDKLPQVWDFIRQQLSAGRQAYVVCPKIDDAGVSTRSVLREHSVVSKALAPHSVGLMHGRLSSEEKEGVMRAFVGGELRALVSTSVIEVGVDVANATVMLIEQAEQFGLAQLHQLRGRIGRGMHESYCILLAAKLDPDTRQRLEILEHSHDGFKVAETDLKIRGPGELLGHDQSGVPQFRFGDLAKDLDLITRARSIAAQLMA